MSEIELGMVLGAAVVVISFICGIGIVAAAMRSSQISQKEQEQNEQNSSGMDEGNY
jgi:hypothetical protein